MGETRSNMTNLEGRPTTAEPHRKRRKQYGFNVGKYIFEFLLDAVPRILADPSIQDDALRDILVDEALRDELLRGLPPRERRLVDKRLYPVTEDGLMDEALVVTKYRTYMRELPDRYACHGVQEHPAFILVDRWKRACAGRKQASRPNKSSRACLPSAWWWCSCQCVSHMWWCRRQRHGVQGRDANKDCTGHDDSRGISDTPNAKGSGLDC